MRSLSLLLIGAALTGACTTAPRETALNAQAEARLTQLLAGRAAGPAQTCLSNYRADDMIRVSDDTVLFRDGSTLFRNDFDGLGCNNLGSGFYSMVTKTSGSGLCRGDIVQIVDLSSGSTVGSCAFGDWVPYRRLG